MQKPSSSLLGRVLDAIVADTRFAFRYFARHKGTTTIIVTVLALGVGANTVIFSIFQGQFLRPPPAMTNDAALARVFVRERAHRAADWSERGVTRAELAALAGQRAIFGSVGAWVQDEIILEAGESSGARTLNAQFVTPNYFPALGVPLVAGTGLRDDTGDAADFTAIMAHAIAVRLFGSPAAAVGHEVRVNQVPVRILGVAPPRFQGARRGMGEPALWLPLGALPAIDRLPPNVLDLEPRLAPFARLAPGATREGASAFARLVVARALPDSADRVGMTRTADVLGLQAPPPGNDARETMLAFIMIAMVGVLILLVAWTNVSSLMVAAAVGRRHEVAVRLSLGASRGRLLRQLVTESTILALAGATAGLTMAWWFLVSMEKREIDAITVTPDPSTLAFVLAVAVASGILFGLSPALHATKAGVATALRDAGTGATSRSRLQKTFVVAQIMLSQPLLVLLGVVISLVIADYQPLAPETSRRVIAIAFRPLEHGAPDQRPEAVDSLLARIATRAEVAGAVPATDGFAIRGLALPGDTAATIVHLQGAAPGWFAVVGAPIILGRDVQLSDTNAADYPIVIGSDLARAMFGGASPIGRTLAAPGVQGFGQDSLAFTVVGVYDAAQRLPGMSWQGTATREGTNGATYHAYTARGGHWDPERVLVRTHGPAEPVMPALQQFIRASAPALPLTGMQTLAQRDRIQYGEALEAAVLSGGAGAIALLLASLGLYGVVSLAVRQRTREIGLRIAVGAEPMRVARMFLASGVKLGAIALALGLPLSLVALKIGLNQGVVIAPRTSPLLIGVVIALVLLGVASAATWIPARRAALVDPARTLRAE